MKRYMAFFVVVTAFVLGVQSLYASRVVLRITKWEEDGIFSQYRDNPGSYPVTQEKLSCITFSGAPDDCIRADGTRIFDTTIATHETGAGEYVAAVSFTGDEVVADLRRYESAGFKVDHVLVFREDYLKRGGPGGPYDEDIRILHPQDLANIRHAIANSNLRCKDSVKIIQLLGSRVAGHRGDTWFDCIKNSELMEHLSNFDGIGTECHVGDNTYDLEPDGPETLQAMAAITKWTQDNGKLAHVFMGGGATTYVQNTKTRLTYEYLWNEMEKLGVEKNSGHLIYFRQGARPGKHVPESENSITSQMKELIGQVWTAENGTNPVEPTTGLVAHWPLDEGSGTETANTAGSSYTATLENGATWGSDATRDSYVSFDGTDDRIATTFTYALHATNDFTWAWWAKQLDAETDSIMVGSRYGNTGSESLDFIKFMRTKASFANTGDAANIENYDYADLPSNEWHHYAMVKDGTSYQWYVDGVAQGSPQTINYSETTAIPFRIGGDIDGKPSSEFFNGYIDDVVLYRQALTPTEVKNVKNGIYLPIVTLTTLGTPVDSTEPTVWSDGQAPHSGAGYVIPDTGNLRGESGTTTFPGNSLTVQAGGKYQVRSLDSAGQITTVNNLILEGGTGANYALLAAGTGTDAINVLDGTITQSGNSQLLTYGSTFNRSLTILSKISGTGSLQVVGAGAIIDNAANTFAGTWEVATGATLTFNNGEAVGSADITVLDGGTLEIIGDWNADASLSVTDTAGTTISLGSGSWIVSNLILGGTAIAEDSYTAAELNALGSTVFTGTGSLRVGQPPAYVVIAAWDKWAATISPATTQTNGITATASTSDFGLSKWGACTDGTFGALESPAASALNDVHEEGLRKNGAVDISIDFTLENSSPNDIELDKFYFDAMLKTASTGPKRWNLQVISGSITTGQIVDEALNYSATGSDLNDYAVSLISLEDHTLESGSSAVFRLSFTGGDAANTSNTDMDNVAITGGFLPVTTPPEPPMMQVEQTGGSFVFAWSEGGFKLQSCTNLADGSWFDYEGGSISPVSVTPTNSAAFFRLIEQ